MSTSSLKTVLGACLQMHGPEVFSYQLHDDFAALWSMQPVLGPVVIVWNETPADSKLDPIRCQNNLSPIDWAVAYAATHETWPTVLVLDLQPDFNRSAPLYRRFLEIRPELFPWLWVLPPKDISFQRIHKILTAGAPTIGPDQRDAHTSLLRDARMTLSEGGPKAEADRHTIANLIGPMILRGGKASNTLHSAALAKLLWATGLIPQLANGGAQWAAQGPVMTQTVAPDRVPGMTETDSGLHILLLDDQANHGWADWVHECLPKAKVDSMTDPNELARGLAEQLDKTGRKDLRFRLKLPKAEESRQPVVLLDLRLFSGRPVEEINFYQSLLPLIKHFKERDDLAWPAFSSNDQDLDRAVKAVTGRTLKLESPEHHEALTWLPRILALADMSLPIVLFRLDRAPVHGTLLCKLPKHHTWI